MDYDEFCDPVGLPVATAAGIVVGAVAVVAVLAGIVAYRIGFMIAVKRLKAYKQAAPFLHLRAQGGGKGSSGRGGGGGKGGGRGISLGFGRLFGGGDDDDGPGGSSSMNFTSGTLSSSAEMGLSKSMSGSFTASMGMSASMDQSLTQSANSSSQMLSKSGTFSRSGSLMGSKGSGVFASKKKRRQQAARAAADERLKEAMMNGSVEDLKSAIVFAQQEGATPELAESAAMLADRLIVGFLGFDLMPDEQPYHIRKDLPLAQKMGAVPPPQYDDAQTTAMPGQIPSPAAQKPVDPPKTPTSPLTTDDGGKLRGFMEKTVGPEAEEENELQALVSKDPGHLAEFEEIAWVSVPKAGGGVKFYNYISKKFREMHNDKLSRDVHYKTEARLRLAEDALVSLVEEADELRAKADAAATQVALLRDELKANTRERWYSNHRQRWHNDPATTLHVEWNQLAGVSAKYCTELVNEYTGTKSYLINRMADANNVAQKVCDKLLASLGLAANVAATGVLQSQHLTFEASATSGPTKLLGKPLPADKCQLTYLALTGGETVHSPDVKEDDRLYFWRGYATGGGSFAAIPIFAPVSGRAMGVLSVDTLHRVPGKALSTVELEALEVIAESLGNIYEIADKAERISITKSIAATAEVIQNRDIAAEGMGGPGAAEARTARSIALSCSMQASEKTLRGPRSLAAQVEAAVLELEGLEKPSKAVISVSMAMLTVIDYEVIIAEMEARHWALPADFHEQMSLWHTLILKGMADIAPNLLMAFDHLVPADISVPNCLRFERAEALLANVSLEDVMADNNPMVVQLLYQWLIAAQEVNNLAVVGREAEIAARQFGETMPSLRPGQVTGDILCDIICKRFA